MKRLMLTVLLALAGARVVLGQALPAYINTGVVTDWSVIPPATNFVNDGTIEVAANTFSIGNLTTALNLFSFLNGFEVFDFTDTQSYTNRGLMSADTGFQFDTAPSGVPPDTLPRHRAANFVNANPGAILSGSATNIFANPFFAFFGGNAAPQLRIFATNIVNTGSLDSGMSGLIAVSGSSVKLRRGSITVEGETDFTSLFNAQCGPLGVNAPGIFDDYWGVGVSSKTNDVGGNFSLSNLFPPRTPTHVVTFANLLPVPWEFSITNAQAFAFTDVVGGNISNQITQVVFVGNTDPKVSTTVRFQQCGYDFPIPVVRWQTIITNNPTLGSITNNLYLQDFFGALTNLETVTNVPLTGTHLPTQIPFNYQFSRFFSNAFYTNYESLAQSNSAFPPPQFPVSIPGTNSYSGYGASVLPVTDRPDPNVPASTFTNVGGRIEITADQFLDLASVRMAGPNYLKLVSTNHFAGSAGAQITFPYGDINLGTTNGSLAVTNLVAPFVPQFFGQIEAWSGRWTNYDSTTGITNRFHILMVASSLNSTSQCVVLNLSLRSTNVVISDLVNVSSNLLINASSLTITSNSPAAPTPVGQLNLLSQNIIWSSSLPNLQYLTNSGVITASNSIYFQFRQNPNFSTPSDGPYVSFVNHDAITSMGNYIWANYVENTASGRIVTNGFVATTNLASIVSGTGLISVQAVTALLTNGQFLAPGFGGDIDLVSGNLSIKNHAIQASGTLTLMVTNQLNFTADGSGRVWTNFWQVSDGITVPLKPSGDLLGTTLMSLAPTNQETVHTWPGQDLGNSPAGFTNNLALGHLILDGGDANSMFTFTGASSNNALYVDLIEFKDGATNRDNFGNFIELNINPGMKIYFGDAQIGGIDISEKLNGANGGQIAWVSNYNAGPFSSTNLLYPGGVIYTFNRGLVTSCDIDSNGNGIPNCQDPTPILEPEVVTMSVILTNNPALTALITWPSPANSTNFLYRKSGFTGTNWALVTNFVQGHVTGPVTVVDKVRTNSALYRVMITPH